MVRSVSRRRFLRASTALAALSAWPQPTGASGPDVVVVGAGAAGMAAARELIGQGLSVTVLEAGDRVGGRLHTDTGYFGVPYDTGAHWLHNGDRNPFVSYGRKNGFDVYRAPDRETVYVGRREASDDEYDAYDAAYSQLIRAISRAAKRGRDVSPASIMPDLGPWGDTVRMAVGPWEMGKDTDHFSCTDWWTGEGGHDWFCRQGFGTLWLHSAQGIPVELSTPVNRIDWSGRGVKVHTNRGVISARACIVTVSTGVLSREKIRFTPRLSAQKQESFQGISMGLYNHIAVQFSRKLPGTDDDGYLLYKLKPSDDPWPHGFGMLTNVSGTNVSLCDVGGGFAGALEKAGRRETVDFALGELRNIFGPVVDKTFLRAHTTQWGSNPLTLGSYASAEPGKTHLRRTLRAPVGDRVWFAGEACSPNEWATVAGAHKTGIKAAQAVASALPI